MTTRRSLPLLLSVPTLLILCPFGALAAGRGCTIEVGDAPASYGDPYVCTTDVPAYLGACADEDGSPLYSAGADLDDNTVGTSPVGTCAVAGDDEDGVTFTTPIDPGQTAGVDVICSSNGNGCFLSAWVDFNGDGDFNDAGEQIFNDQLLAVGNNSLTFPVPAGATMGNTYARFFGCDGAAQCNTPTSTPSFGEIEDYLVTVTPVDLQTFTIE